MEGGRLASIIGICTDIGVIEGEVVRALREGNGRGEG